MAKKFAGALDYGAGLDDIGSIHGAESLAGGSEYLWGDATNIGGSRPAKSSKKQQQQAPVQEEDDLAAAYAAAGLTGPSDEDASVWSELTEDVGIPAGRAGRGGGGGYDQHLPEEEGEEGEDEEGDYAEDGAAGGGAADEDGGDLDDDDEEHDEKEGLPESLPDHACAYCNIYNPSTVVRCSTTGKWFCNARGSGHGGSHIVQHLVRGKYKEVSLHPDSPLGDAILECYNWCVAGVVHTRGWVVLRWV